MIDPVEAKELTELIYMARALKAVIYKKTSYPNGTRERQNKKERD